MFGSCIVQGLHMGANAVTYEFYAKFYHAQQLCFQRGLERARCNRNYSVDAAVADYVGIARRRRTLAAWVGTELTWGGMMIQCVVLVTMYDFAMTTWSHWAHIVTLVRGLMLICFLVKEYGRFNSWHDDVATFVAEAAEGAGGARFAAYQTDDDDADGDMHRVGKCHKGERTSKGKGEGGGQGEGGEGNGEGGKDNGKWGEGLWTLRERNEFLAFMGHNRHAVCAGGTELSTGLFTAYFAFLLAFAAFLFELSSGAWKGFTFDLTQVPPLGAGAGAPIPSLNSTSAGGHN